MIDVFWWAAVGASSLALGALVAIKVDLDQRVLGWIMAFGAGVLISAVAYVVEGAVTTSAGSGGVAVGLLAGSAVYFIGDLALARRFGDEALIDGRARAQVVDTSDRDASTGQPAVDVAAPPDADEGRAERRGSTGLAIVMGAVLDGIPESIVLGLTLVGGGGIGIAVLVAVFLSNFPEGIAASAELKADGWSGRRIMLLWFGIVFVSVLAALIGYAMFDDAAPHTIVFVDVFAGGAILTMLANTMMPQAYAKGGRAVGLITTLGFIVAFALNGLD